VLLVIPLGTAPAAAFGANAVLALPVSRPGLARLSDYLWDALAKSGAGELQEVAAGPAPGSLFFAATGTYDMSRTCNTWTAEALNTAGLPVQPAGIVFAGQVLDAAHRYLAAVHGEH
jgi:hypothetical protein